MKTRWNLLGVLVLGLALGSFAQAQDEEATMTVVDDEELPEQVVNRIELPDSAADEARESAAFGLETANEAREDGRAFGERVSEEAREGNIPEQVRETLGERPGLDDLPGPDSLPERPETPGGQP